MLSVDRGVEVCSSPGQKTCCGVAAEGRLIQVAVEEAYDIVASATSSLRTLVADNAVLYRRESRFCLKTGWAKLRNNGDWHARTDGFSHYFAPYHPARPHSTAPHLSAPGDDTYMRNCWRGFFFISTPAHTVKLPKPCCDGRNLHCHL